MRRNAPPMPKDGIYSAILWVLIASAVSGVLIAIGAETLVDSPALNQFGTSVTLISGVLYAFFRFLGEREAKRREAAKDGSDKP